MKAIVYTEYGGPEALRLSDAEKPSPGIGEVLIRAHAVSVIFGDLLALNFKHVSPRKFNMPFLFWLIARFSFGIRKPSRSILGNTFSGEIVATGSKVKCFKAGDKIFGHTAEKMGALAEYLVMKENGIIALKPQYMSFEEAASVPYGAITALYLLRKTKLQKGMSVLIAGASGAIGSAALQLAKNLYQAEVTAVCHPDSSQYVKSLGADKVVHDEKEHFATSAEHYDLIIDVLGKGTFSKYKNILTPKGIYLSVSFKGIKPLQMLWTSLIGGKKVLCALANNKQEDLIFIKDTIEAGKFIAVTDRIFSFDEAPDAYRYADTAIKKGAVIIRII